jgi:hypothetical protein
MEFPAEWVQNFGVQLVTAYPAGLGARFRWHERIRPQPAFSAIVDRMLASDPDFRVRNVDDMVRTATVEGEYGAWVAVEGQRDGRPAMRFIGAVFLDEFASVLDVIAIIPEHFTAVREHSFELLRTARFDLAKRPRRFFYVPPVGWQAVPSGTTTNWYPPDFPRHRANLVVPPARHFDDAAAELIIEAASAELGLGLDDATPTRDTITSAGGNPGVYLRAEGKRAGVTIYRELALFVVAPFVYRMRLESATESRVAETREILRGVAGSFKPLPNSDEGRTGRAFASRSTLFDHWAS